MTLRSVQLPLPDEFRFTLEVIDRVVSKLGGVCHQFMEEDQFFQLSKSRPPEAPRIYWYELLARTHIGAHLSLSRTSAWLKGVDTAWTAPNFLLYAAAMRGLLESCADSWFAFRFAPMTLATHHYHIFRALRGKSTDPA